MKKLVLGFCVAMALAFGSQAWAATMYFEPFVSYIYVGESLDVNVAISGLGEFDDVGAFDFNVVFDDAVLAFDSYTLTENLGDISAGDAEDLSGGDLGGGTVNLSELSWLGDLSFQDDPLVLATLSFTGIGEGASLLKFEYSPTSPYYISDTWGDGICTVPIFGVVKVDPVPEPATFILFGLGIVGLVGIRSRRKKN